MTKGIQKLRDQRIAEHLAGILKEMLENGAITEEEIWQLLDDTEVDESLTQE
jgi:hypothetical protein